MQEKKPLDILLVDDSDSILTSYARIIQRMLADDNYKDIKYSIETALNGAQAIEKVKAKGRFDLIITDNGMPIMGGIEFYKLLKTISPGQQARVVMFSGDDLDYLQNRVAKSLGADDHKPLPIFGKFDLGKQFYDILKYVGISSTD